MGLGAGGGAVVLFLVPLWLLPMSVVAMLASFDAMDAHLGDKRLVHRKLTRRVSLILMPFVLIAVLVGTTTAYLLGGDRIGFWWALAPAVIGSLGLSHVLAKVVRRLEFGVVRQS